MSSIFTRLSAACLGSVSQDKLHPRLFHQQDLVMGEVAEEGERFTAGGDHEHGMAVGVSGRTERLNAGQECFALGCAGESALGRAQRKRSVGNHGHFRVADFHAVELG
jgi:hypothetical protein